MCQRFLGPKKFADNESSVSIQLEVKKKSAWDSCAVSAIGC